MDDACTHNDLIRFMYRDLAAGEATTIAENLRTNFELRHYYERLFASKHEMPKATFLPAPQTIQNILNYSRMTAA